VVRQNAAVVYPVDNIFPLPASLTVVPEVEVMRGEVVINRDVTVISVNDGRAHKSDRDRYQPPRSRQHDLRTR